ncbi:hypothetical protein FAY30_21950 [Bacillus sp. S3]|uniref:hypothetical protein n=1 Tax=Bacillus sp. S3 TaxID=486398 RepID=UPI00118AFB8B|nr:hypothetical protein [Bacillus sp. S3]QCJ44353.1 hypothetical protein FAY30_21950 [Bacillus sp. S3]
MKKWSWLFVLLLTGVLLSGCNSKENAEKQQTSEQTENASKEAEEATSEPKSALKLLENEKAGKYLADADGKALYYFKNDKPNTSNCSGECLQNWPSFYEENFDVPEGFNKEDFGSITRADTGEKQTTYKGYPLYYFVKDQVSGDVNGQGVKEIWFIVNNETTF